jgi:hypothetical protein
MALEDHVRTKESGKDVAAMHDFIRKQAVNQEADYSVRACVPARVPARVLVCVFIGGLSVKRVVAS